MIVNWTELRRKMLIETKRIDFCKASYWDREAETYNQNVLLMGELTQQQLRQLPVLSQFTVLDVGAGTGRLTIPIAKHAKYVTALEPSSKMLALLKANATIQRVNNIKYLNKSLDDLETSELETHDIVVASFSLFMVDMEKALLKMDALASVGVYLFVSASDWMDPERRDIALGKGKNSTVMPDHIYICNILNDIGIDPNVDIWDFQSRQCYNDLASAISRFMQLYHISPDKEGELKAYLNKTLVQDERGKLWLNRKRKAAKIWWTKTKQLPTLSKAAST
ncbi:MAG: methyltransferase domain-containing protein [Candidatus Bathyarchaeota archaeon]|nr:methyltransferase domain-containing protein [Candidatus Bathyarchaeota archaeon]